MVPQLNRTPVLCTISFACAALPSCMRPDPTFLRNAAAITDAAYPPDKIVGVWVSANTSPVRTPTSYIESKSYYHLRQGGGGSVRQYTKNKASGNWLSAEAPLRWFYLGSNKWNVQLPPSSEYTVTGSQGDISLGYRGALTFTVRYHQGRIYDVAAGRTLVRDDPEEIRRLAEEERNRPPLIEIR